MAKGTRIGEHVVLEAMIGGGALGVVWRGWHEAFECPVAVKLLVALDDEARERFDVEGKLIVRMSCPNIVRVLDCGHHDDVPYLVMELLEGETLLDRLDREGYLDDDVVADIVEQVAAGLEHAHRRGVIHRDIKPDNIFLTADDDGTTRAVIVDFGIAKPGWDMAGRKPTAAGTLMGSPSYMSPEQLVNSSAVTTASDTWSLAIVAFEAITGRVPFGMTDDITEVAMAILRRCYAEEYTFERPLPEHLTSTFAQAFHPSAGSQFRTPRAFARALSSSLEDAIPPLLLTRESQPTDPLVPPEPDAVATTVPLESRWPLWTAAALLIIGALGGLWLVGGSPRDGAAAGVRAATPRLDLSARAAALPLPHASAGAEATSPYARAQAPRSTRSSSHAVSPAPPPRAHAPDPPPRPPQPPLPQRNDYGF